jgi:voltage-dependent potassium channel beta subunit
MLYRQLGTTGLQMTAFSFGTWQTFGETVDLATADRIVSTAYDLGIRCFDGAEAYALGKADEMMGNVLAKKEWPRDSYTLTGKCIRRGNDVPSQVGVSRKRLVECCELTLKRYQTDYLDLFFCHRPDGLTPPEEIVITMNALIGQGKILYWGTSEFDPTFLERMWQFADRHGMAGPVVEQTIYNMTARDRLEKALVPLFEKWGMGTTVYSPVATGLLTGKYNDGIPKGSRFDKYEFLKNRVDDAMLARLKKIQGVADDLGVSMAALALGWVLKNPNVSTAILGASAPEQIERNMAALDTLEKLTPEVMEKLEVILGE